MRFRGLVYLPAIFFWWLICFQLYRLVFFLIITSCSGNFAEGIYHGFVTDLAAAAYLMVLPVTLWFIANFFRTQSKGFIKIILISQIVLAVFVAFIEVVSLPLYPEWGTTFNLRALVSAESPGEAFTTFVDFLNWKWLLLFAAEVGVAITGFYFIQRYFYHPLANKTLRIILPIIIAILITVGIRGGIGEKHITVSSVFYTHHQSDNYLAVNKTFYFISTVKQKKHLDIITIDIQKERLNATYAKLYVEGQASDSLKLFATNRPNIVLIVLEGCPAEVFAPLGGMPGIAPCFEKLCSEGLLFTQFFASGFRTDQGLLSILSGLPALPYLNIMTDPKISEALPSLIQVLGEKGYNTAFIYGGDASFSKISDYMKSNNTATIIDKASFNKHQCRIEWGAPDDELFIMAGQQIKKYSEPFFACILTQSTHTPFEIEGRHKFPGENISEKYKSSVYFTDSCIGSFIERSRQTSWFNNTIFIITADHGSLYLGTHDFNDHERFRIPLLIFGTPLAEKFKGKIISRVGGSFDIPATLLAQLNIENRDFHFSKNLFNDRMYDHAYWATDQIMGWITDNKKVVFNFSNSDIYSTEGDTVHNAESVKDAIRFYKMVAEYTLLKKNPSVR